MPSVYRPHAIAAAGLAAAIALRWLLDPWLGAQFPLICLFAAVAIAASTGGWQTALWVTALGWFVARWMFVEPRESFSMNGAEYGRVLAYLVTSCVITAFGETMRRMVRRANEAQHAAEQDAS